MRVVLQRVSHASVAIGGEVVGQIAGGLLVLVGITQADAKQDIDWLVQKIMNLRIFDDANGIMNLSVLDLDAQLLVVSQFTLHALTKKGNRPSYIKAASPDLAIPLYELLVLSLEQASGKKVATGRFGADMQVSLCNDGPVTILIDSKNKE